MKTPAMSRANRKLAREQIASEVASGEPLNVLAHRNGCTIQHVRNCYREFNVHPPDLVPQGYRNTAIARFSCYPIIAALFNPEKSYAAIMAEFGVSKGRISHIRRHCIEAGIPLPPRRVGRKP